MIEIIKKNKLLAAVSLAYIFLFIAMPDKAYLSVKNSIYYIIEMLEIMPLIFILTSIIEAWVPKEVIMNGFGEKAGIKGVYSRSYWAVFQQDLFMRHSQFAKCF